MVAESNLFAGLEEMVYRREIIRDIHLPVLGLLVKMEHERLIAATDLGL